MSPDQTKKVKLAVIAATAFVAIAFAIYMIIPTGESGPSQAEIEAAQKAQEMVKAAEEAAAQGNKTPPPPPPPVKVKGGFGPSSGP